MIFVSHWQYPSQRQGGKNGTWQTVSGAESAFSASSSSLCRQSRNVTSRVGELGARMEDGFDVQYWISFMELVVLITFHCILHQCWNLLLMLLERNPWHGQGDTTSHQINRWTDLPRSIDWFDGSSRRLGHAMDFVPKATTKIAMRGREGRKRDFLKRRPPSRLNSGKKWNGMGAAN